MNINIKFIEKVLYIIAVVLMALNFIFDLPTVGKVGYGVLFASFAVSFVSRRTGKKRR